MTNRKMMENFFRLLDENRSRYEEQAKLLLSQKRLEIKVSDYNIRYSVKDGAFSSSAKPLSGDLNHYQFEVPIPETAEKQIQELIELFAKSEAVCM